MDKKELLKTKIEIAIIASELNGMLFIRSKQNLEETRSKRNKFVEDLYETITNEKFEEQFMKDQEFNSLNIN